MTDPIKAEWIKGNGEGSDGKHIEVVVRHCNPKLKLDDLTLKGKIGDDGFYLNDGGELSWNWDIIKWRFV